MCADVLSRSRACVNLCRDVDAKSSFASRSQSQRERVPHTDGSKVVVMERGQSVDSAVAPLRALYDARRNFLLRLQLAQFGVASKSILVQDFSQIFRRHRGH